MKKDLFVCVALAAAFLCRSAFAVEDDSSYKSAARLYYEGDEPVLSFSDVRAGAEWLLTDWRGKCVRSGEADANGRVAVGKLPPGYWSVVSGDSVVGNFTVVPRPETRRLVEHSPFAVDSAFSWVASQGHFVRKFENSYRHVAWLMRAAGIVETRERMKWTHVQPDKAGKVAWGRYLPNADLLKDMGIGISGMFHDSPDWTRSTGKHVPTDLMAFYRFCRQAANDFGDRMWDWEVWNEPEGMAPPWEMAWLTKIAALACRSAVPTMHVTSPSTTAGLDCTYDNLFFSNHMFKYADIFNTHSYMPLSGYEDFQKRTFAMLARNGCENIPVMITECGTETEGAAACEGLAKGFRCHSPEQEIIVADFIPKSQILRQVGGVLRNYFFIFGSFSERGWTKDWGILRRDGSAKPGVAAFSALTAVLQGLECLGAVDCGKGVSCYAYVDRDGTKTLAFWGKGQVSLCCRGTARLTDWCGTERTVEAKDGRLSVAAEQHVSYLRGRLDVKVSVPARKPMEPSPYIAAADEDLEVVLAVRFNPEDFRITDGNCTAELIRGGSGRVTVEAWNFSDRERKGRIHSKNGEVEGLSDEVTVPAWGVFRREVRVKPVLDAGDVANWKLRGVFAGRKTSVVHVRIRDVAKFLGKCRTVELDWRNDELWSVNDSAPIHSKTRETDGSIRFDSTWTDPHSDRWSYPSIKVEKGLAKGAKIIEFEVKSWQDKVENDFKKGNVFLSYGKSGGERIPKVMPPIGEWEVRRVGLPPTRDPAELTCIALGGGHPKGHQLKVWFRNVKLYVDPDADK